MQIIYKDLSQKIVEHVYKLHKQKLGEGYLTIDFLKENEFFIDKKIELTASCEQVVIFNTCASKYERRGIGALLFDFALKTFAVNKKVYCPVWKCGENINAHKLLTKFGFTQLITLEKFWYNESLNTQNFCPVCGSPCVCDNVIYLKKRELN